VHNIYLVQVNNRFGDNVFLPYSVGLVQSYCQSIPRIDDSFSFGEFVYLRDDPEETALGFDDPKIVGISCYIWNWEWSKALARSVKQRHPDCIVVLGGPQVPTRSENFFQQHPYADLLVHYEGEQTFADILLQYLKKKPDYILVPGLSVRLEDNRCVQTPSRERMTDLADLPSPYLSGAFDGLMKEPYNFQALQETHRGCPYSCTFCDWGSAVFTKVRAFSDQRLERELEWFGRNRIELLYNCDANYGLLKRDIELTENLVETKRRFGFPQQFRAAYAKNSDTRVFQIAKALNEAGMSKGVTLSTQSMDAHTLDVIKRTNIKIENFADLMNKYRSENIPTYTELIIGLPGETYESFAQGIDQLLEAGQHEGLNVYLCSVLPNSEMADPSYMAEQGIKSVEMPILLLHSTPADDGVQERNEIIVETNSFSQADFKGMFLFSWIVQGLHCLGLTQYISVFLKNRYGLSYSGFYGSLLAHASDNPGTLLGEEYRLMANTVDQAMLGGGWGVILPQFGDIQWPNEEGTFLNLVCNKDRFYSEITGFLQGLLLERQMGLDDRLMDDLLTYQQAIIVDPFAPKSFIVELRHDLLDYFNNVYQGRDAQVAEQARSLQITPDEFFDGDLKRYARHVVWYGRKGGSFKHTNVINVTEAGRLPVG